MNQPDVTCQVFGGFFLFLKDNALSFSSAVNTLLLFLVFSGAAPSIVLHLSKKIKKWGVTQDFCTVQYINNVN